MPIANRLRSIFLIKFFLILFVALEAGLSIGQMILRDRESRQFEPFYATGTVDRAGRLISSHDGPLKIRLDPFMDFVLSPNQSNEHFNIDAQGFRVCPPLSGEPRPEPFAVILGGSMAFGTGLRRDHDSIACRLGESLNKQVLNAAVPGYRSQHALASVMWHYKSWGSAYYIIVDGFNDSSMPLCGAKEPSQIPVQKLMALNYFTDPNPLKRIFLGFPRLIFSSTILTFGERQHCDNMSPSVFQEAAVAYVAYQKQLRELVTAKGSKVYCFFQPAMFSMFDSTTAKLRISPDQTEIFSSTYDYFRSAVNRILEKENFKCVDLNLYKNRYAPTMFLDPIHLDAEGNRVSAGIIQENLN